VSTAFNFASGTILRIFIGLIPLSWDEPELDLQAVFLQLPHFLQQPLPKIPILHRRTFTRNPSIIDPSIQVLRGTTNDVLAVAREHDVIESFAVPEPQSESQKSRSQLGTIVGVRNSVVLQRVGNGLSPIGAAVDNTTTTKRINAAIVAASPIDKHQHLLPVFLVDETIAGHGADVAADSEEIGWMRVSWGRVEAPVAVRDGGWDSGKAKETHEIFHTSVTHRRKRMSGEGSHVECLKL